MKRYIQSSEDIFCMSFPRKVALKHLGHYAEAIRDHILKCILYKDIRQQDMYHWLHDELSSWLEDASGIKCDSKLKQKDYLDSVFAEFGSDLQDTKYSLIEFRDKYCVGIDDPYPWFDINFDLMKETFRVFTEFKSETLPLLMKKDVVDQDTWYSIISKLF